MTTSNNELSRQHFIDQLTASWNELQATIAALTPAQLTEPTDAAGWTVKDHLIHLAIWEEAAIALLNVQPRREAMDIPADVWAQEDDDAINAIIQQRYRDLPLNDVLRTLQQTHDRLLAKLDTLSEADLLQPYRTYRPESDDERALLMWLPYDTVHHYHDHIGWIKAIVEQA